MHLDRRGYAYETFRESGRVRRRYVGGGELASALVWLDAHDRQREADAKRAAGEIAKREQSSASELNAFCAVSGAVFRAVMDSGSYHRHKRGVWRKARKPMAKPQTQTELAKVSDKAPDSEYLALLKRANNGDKDAALQVLALVKGTPEEAALLDILASFSEVAREGLLSAITDSELRKAGFRRQLEVVRDDLAGPNPTRLELHLAERVALCALAVARLESVFFQNVSSSPKAWEAAGRQLDGAHRRHLDAVKALATVRKLQLPNVQVNIGEKQVNIASMNGAGEVGKSLEKSG